MALFDYTGQLQSGSAFQGTLEAESREHAEAMLSDMGVRVVSLRATRRTVYVPPLSLDDFQFFNEQIAALTRAAVPMEEALRQLAADVGSGRLKRVLLDIADDLRAGETLDAAIEKRQAYFPSQYAGLVRAGLQTGDLGGALYAMTTHLRLKDMSRRALLELGAYPLVVMILAFAVVSFLMHAVVPEIERTVGDMYGVDYLALSPGSPTPPGDRLVFAVARSWSWVEGAVAALAFAVAASWALTYLPGGRALRHGALRRIPGVARVYQSSVLARFTHTAALAAYSGMPLPQLLTAAGAASGDEALAAAAKRVSERVTNGTPLEEAVREERALPSFWVFVVSVASRRNDLPGALEELARTYELRARQWVGALRVVLGPVLLILVGALLGLVVMSILAPLARLLNALSF